MNNLFLEYHPLSMVLFGEEGLVQDFQPEVPDGKLNTKIKTEWVEEDVYNETENDYGYYEQKPLVHDENNPMTMNYYPEHFMEMQMNR